MWFNISHASGSYSMNSVINVLAETQRLLERRVTERILAWIRVGTKAGGSRFVLIC